MVTLVEFLSSSYIGKLKEFLDYIRHTGGRLNGMSLDPGDWIQIRHLIDDYQYIKVTGHDLSLAIGQIGNTLNPVVARVALQKLDGKIPERGKKAARRRLPEALLRAIEHFVILLEQIR